MAWRPYENLIAGELDNTVPGKVTGWLRFLGMEEEVKLDLNGDFHRDIRGAKIRLRNPQPADRNHTGAVGETRQASYMHGFSPILTGTTAAAPAATLQVWVEDMHRRVEATDYLPPGEPSRTVRFVGARNGTFSAQVVVRASAAVSGLTVTPQDLSREGGGTLPGAAISVAGLAPYPAQDFTPARLGDERGLNATFPDGAALARAEALTAGKPAVFDHITPALPDSIPADTACPFWLRLTVPRDLPAGAYKGQITIAGQALTPVSLPVVAEVANWTLPGPQSYQTLVCSFAVHAAVLR